MKKIDIKEIIKIMLELAIIYFILQVGIYISKFIKPVLFVPGSIVGMILLLLLLSVKIMQVKEVKKSGKFLLKNMGFFFIPLGVGLINSVDLLKEFWLELILIIVISGSLVMFVSAKVTDVVIDIVDKKKRGEL